jgi:hypothetical protein
MPFLLEMKNTLTADEKDEYYTHSDTLNPGIIMNMHKYAHQVRDSGTIRCIDSEHHGNTKMQKKEVCDYRV